MGLYHGVTTKSSLATWSGIPSVPTVAECHGGVHYQSSPQGELHQGYIHPSTSPAASSFLFVAKKDSGLRPCIDYCALNTVTVTYCFPLPLVPAEVGTLSGAAVFTKLDLGSSYNLIRIHHGDEWKMAFINPTDHYKYQVMLYKLANAPSIFQGFMNKIFREYLHRYVIIYIDDILIYGSSLAEHQ